MGCSQSAEEKELKQKNEVLDKQIKEDAKRMQDEVKMLLLGELSFIWLVGG